jgi:hypothetical protein
MLVVISGKEGNSRKKEEKDTSRDQIRILITKKEEIFLTNLYRVIMIIYQYCRSYS